MCGRYVLRTPPELLQTLFQIQRLKYTPAPHYNIAPTQTVAAVVQSPTGTRGLVGLKWGLIPPWAKDESQAAKMINARSESVHEKPSFRDAFRERRCLILADGFYEWKKGNKQPVYIHDASERPLAFAGLYSFWVNPRGQRIDTCAILTTAANPKIEHIHHRMPVILGDEAAQNQWLDKQVTALEHLQPLLQAYPAEATALRWVNPAVNKVSTNSPQNLEPYTPEQPEAIPHENANVRLAGFDDLFN